MKIAIIGAGFAGLSAAWDLAGAGHEVVVIDPLDRPGGLAAGFRADGWAWPLENYYHHLFLSDRYIYRLAEEIGFQGKIVPHRPVSASFIDGRSLALDGVLPILRFDKIPFLDRVRMGAVGAWLKITRDWRALESITAETWLRRWMGSRAYEVVWKPLLIGKFGQDHHRDVPMSWLWARLHARTFRLGYPEGGFQAFADALQRAVESRGARVRLSTTARRIEAAVGGGIEIDIAGVGSESDGNGGSDGGSGAEGSAIGRSDGGREVDGIGGGVETYDRVIVTAGPSVLARLAPGLDAKYLARLAVLESMGAVVAVLALRRSLLTDGTYWLNMDTRDFPFLAVVEHTNLIDRGHYGGDHLVYVGHYLKPDHRYFDLPPDEIVAEWLPALTRINPDFDPSWVRESWVHSTRYAQPVVPLGFSEHVPPIRTPMPGLYFASMSQVYPWDRGTNFAVEIGRRAAAELLRGEDPDADRSPAPAR